jgi:hypothetical protein
MLKQLQNAMTIVAFACILLGFGIVEWQLLPSVLHPPPQRHHSTQNQKESGAADDKNKADKSIGQLWMETRNDPAIFFAFCVAVFTFILAASTIGLWTATGLMLRHSRKSSERQLQAYVHIEDVDMSEMNSVYDVMIQVIVNNFGQTPARQVTNTFKWCISTQQPEELDFGLDAAQIEGLCDLAPSQETFSTFRYPHLVWQRDKPAIGSKTMTFHIFGRIDYRDIFGCHRTSEYRFRVPIGATGIPDETSLVMDGKGNRTT